MTFQAWTKRHIFEPLGMKDSFFMKNSSQIIKSRAVPYAKGKEGFIKNRGPWVNSGGMGYLFTHIDDMILWMDNYRTMRVGGEAVVKKMF